MLPDDAKNEIRTCLQAIANAMPHFRRRHGQQVLIAAVAKTLARCPDPSDEPPPDHVRDPGSTILCVNGGTGLGKSLGYSVPGVIMALRKGKKLVISTGTVALQEQLIKKDLPLFFHAAQIPVSLELAKGRTRYVCRYRLANAITNSKQDSLLLADSPDDDPSSPLDLSQPDVRTILEQLAADLEASAWDGDRDNRTKIPDRLWAAITTDRHGCLGHFCGAYKTCVQVAARKRLKSAQVIVANHDLVLADLAMGGGRLLPPPSEVFYCFDEAHHLPDKAVAAFASTHLIGADRKLFEKGAGLGADLVQAIGAPFLPAARAIETAAARIVELLTDAFEFFDDLSILKPSAKNPQPILDFHQSFVPDEFVSIGAGIHGNSSALLEHLRAGVEQLGMRIAVEGGGKQHDRLLGEVSMFIGRVEDVQRAWALFLEQPAPEHPPIAKWVSAVLVKRQLDYRLSASPVRAGGYLNLMLWEKAAGVILASANLATLGNFADFRRRAGLLRYESVTCVDLPSPFDYPRQGTIEIPPMKAPPTNYKAHTSEIVKSLESYIDGAPAQGMLVLFTSRNQMLDVRAQIAEMYHPLLLVQGTDSKSNLLDAHRSRIDDGQASVILGLESFSEGVDLPAQYCTRVVITKIPFDVPDDPVLKTLTSWIDQRGGKSFLEVLVPSAARKLEQRVGRLIRTESDTGIVTILDPRLWDKPYGKLMLRGLPPFRLVVRGREVRL
jgi:ATP-dependent DNA helicase DinG